MANVVNEASVHIIVSSKYDVLFNRHLRYSLQFDVLLSHIDIQYAIQTLNFIQN